MKKYSFARIFDAKDIRGIAFVGLDELMMSVMPLQPKIYKILGEITWNDIAGRNVPLV